MSYPVRQEPLRFSLRSGSVGHPSNPNPKIDQAARRPRGGRGSVGWRGGGPVWGGAGGRARGASRLGVVGGGAREREPAFEGGDGFPRAAAPADEGVQEKTIAELKGEFALAVVP